MIWDQRGEMPPDPTPSVSIYTNPPRISDNMKVEPVTELRGYRVLSIRFFKVRCMSWRRYTDMGITLWYPKMKQTELKPIKQHYNDTKMQTLPPES